MLNKHGEGTVYFGVKNDGTIIDQKDINESTLRNVSRMIAEGIDPQIIPHITLKYINNLNIIKVTAKGSDVPYQAFGKYYCRSYDEDKKMERETLKKLMFRDGLPDITTTTRAQNQNLSFEIIKIYYINHNININQKLFEKT